MSNLSEYYDHTSYPATGAAGSSAAMRAELDAIETAFNKLPTLTGNGGKLLKVAASADNLETSSVISENGTDATISGDLYVSGGQIGQSSGQKHTIPAVANDTLALLAAAQALTNKTIVAASNTITTAASGNLAATELNAALAELQADIDTRATSTALTSVSNDLTNHLNDGTDAHDASAISVVPSGNLAASDVQAALVELQSDIDGRQPLDATLTSLAGAVFGEEFTNTATSALQVPSGTTVQRPAGATGKIRYNSDLGRFEGYGSAWSSLGGGATGGGSDAVFHENDQTVNNDYTITSGKNAVSAGPITIANTKTVTVPDGSVWTIV
jgi:hypothetical protein